MYDVAIIGGGVVGCFVARELARYPLKICVLEANSDVAMGASGANSGIVHGGYDPLPNSAKARFNSLGCKMMPQIAQELDVPYKQCGSLVVAFTEDEVATLQSLKARGEQNGVEGLSIVNAQELQQLEPHISTKAIAALRCTSAGIICPYTLTIAAMENAMMNGVKLFLNCAVRTVRPCNPLPCEANSAPLAQTAFEMTTNIGTILANSIINAAGASSAALYQMAAEHATNRKEALKEQFALHLRKGEYLLLDKEQGGTVNHVIFQTPTALGKGILVTNTVDGNLLLGPTAQSILDATDTTTSRKGLEQVQAGALKSVPSLHLREAITTFCGVRAGSITDDFIVGESPIAGFFNAAGIDSPGLSAAPAIGVFLAEQAACRLQCTKKTDFKPCGIHYPQFRLLSNAQKKELIAQNSAYANIICRCETVTEGEILDAIHRPCGAVTVDGVKRRTRAGMGRCQGGFCLPKVMELIAREANIPLDAVTKSGKDSAILTGKTK